MRGERIREVPHRPEPEGAEHGNARLLLAVLAAAVTAAAITVIYRAGHTSLPPAQPEFQVP